MNRMVKSHVTLPKKKNYKEKIECLIQKNAANGKST